MDGPAANDRPEGWNPIADRFGPVAGAEWQVLLNQFVIGEGFALLILTVPGADAAKLCRVELEKFLATRGERLIDAEIGEPDDLRILTPYLLALPRDERNGALWVEAVVGVTAPDYDTWYEAWFAALTGLNQQRNPFRRQFDYPVILVGAPWMAAIMCDHAPDLWSIRSLAIHIEPESAAPLPERQQLEPDPVTPMEAPVRPVRRFDPKLAMRASDAGRGVVGRERNLIVLLGRAAAGFAGQGGWTQGESLWREAADTARRVGDLALEAEAHLQLGDLMITVGRTADAMAEYRAGHVILERLAAADPGNAAWQRDLSVSHNKIGDVLVGQGDLAAALGSYRASLSMAERLAAADPGNAGWQRDLSVSHNKIGDVQQVQGDLVAALERYRASLTIAERLAAADRGNAGWQRDVAVSNAKLGAACLANQDPAQARHFLLAGRAIMAGLVARYPDWVEWKRDLAWVDGQLAALGP